MVALYITIWISVWLFACGEVGRARYPDGVGWAWRASAAGLVLAVIHSILAFGLVHAWQHDAAVSHTAAQTQAVFGRPVGTGLYVNYVFFAVWGIDLAAWRSRRGVLHRSRPTTIALRVFYAVMLVNGAVIFAAGARRPLGLLLMLVLLAAWLKPSQRRSGSRSTGMRH